MRAYDALAGWHYRASRPRAPRLVLAARVPGLNSPAGVVVLTHPVLNAWWRPAVWPGWALGGAPAQRARAINAGLSCIARVIVDPRVRACGIGVRLVQQALARSPTARVEALAALGDLAPLFARAGMTRVPAGGPDLPADLRAALRSAGVHRWQLAHAPTRARLARRADFARALERYARASRATRGVQGRPCALQLEALWPRLAARPAVYVWQAMRGGQRGASDGQA